MNKSTNPVRLLVEILGIVGLSEVVVMLALPTLVPGLTGFGEGVMDVVLLALIAGPMVYLRCLAALRSAAAPAVSSVAQPVQRVQARSTIALVVGTQVVGLVLTGVGMASLKHYLDEARQKRFDREADHIEAEVLRRFNHPLLGLKGARGAFDSRDGFSRSAFRAYFDSQGLLAEFPGVRGFGYIERVARSDLQKWVAAERADGVPDFAVATRGNAPDLLVVKYIEPFAANRPALGFDVGQDAVRREAAERAIATGQPALTGRVALLQDAQRVGFLYFLPVYHPKTGPSQGRPAELAGLLYTAFLAKDMLQGVVPANDPLFDFELFQGDGTRAEQLIYDADSQLHTPADAPLPGPGDSLHSTRTLVVGGQSLVLRIRSTPAFAAAQDYSSVAIAGIGGAAGSSVMTLLVWLLAAGRLRAQRIAERITTDLDRMARVVQFTNNAVTLTDAQSRITWVNGGFTRLTGYSQEEALGKTPGELLGSGKADAGTLQTLADSIAAGSPCRVEILNRAKDGREYWVDTEVQPTRDAQGVLQGFMEIGTDITLQKRTLQRLEAAIRDSAALLTTLEVHAITSTADRDGRITDVNDAFCAISGYGRDELLGQDHRVVSAKVHPPAFWEDVWATISSGSSWRGDICNRRKDGSLYWLDSMIAPFIGDDGSVEKYVSICTDITASKADQLRMLEMTDRLALAIEGGNDGLWDWMDVSSSAQWWSPSYYRLLGYTPEELPASRESFFSILHPDHLQRCSEATEWAIAKGKDYDEENLLRTKAHGYRWFRARAKVYRNEAGQALRMAGATQDIHDRKLAQASVVKTSQRFALAADSAKIGVWEWDLLTNNLAWDARMYQLFQRTSSVANTPIVVLADSLHPQDRERFDAALQETILSAQPFEGDYRIVWPDGEVRHIRATARVMRDDTGRATRLTGVNFDITEVKRSEEALSRAVIAAEEASRSKSQFLANMSHEIRTPMNAILGMLKLLQNTELTVRQSDYAAKTEGAARSLLGLLNDILDFSKVEAGKMSLDPRVFRVDRLLRDLSVILSANVGGKDIEVLFDIDPALPPFVVGDDMRLQQVLINLGGNAIKFTSTGEVVLRLRVVERTDSQVWVEFAMQDTGIGIAPQNQAHIFSGFSQAEASTTRRFGGTGLGLAISSRLVGLLGGSLEVESVLGQGSRFHFRVWFPVAPVPLQEVADRDTHALDAMPTLIVDDNDVTREVLCGMAQSLGWQVDAVASGTAALAAMDERAGAGKAPYAAVFLDWQMPGMDGWQTCQHIRQRRVDGSAPIVVMVTAHGRDKLSQRSAAEQALLNGFLVKPVTASMLLDAVWDARFAADAAHDGRNPQPLQVVRKPKRLLGLRLLVVEDNKINQMVAQGLLSAEGAEVRLADDGQLGVDAVISTVPGFDVVLMDLQMPVMDGYEATRTIRQTLGMRDLPIIAMTANAMASDRAACLAVGMNDHVGKPFELDQLVEILLRYSGRAPQVDAVVQQPTAPVLPLPQVPSVEYLPGDMDVAGALQRMGGNTIMYASVLRTFVRDLERMPSQLAAYLNARQVADGLRVLHTLKGLSLTVGARHLAAVVTQLEAQCMADAQGWTQVKTGQVLAVLQSAADASLKALQPVLLQYPGVADAGATAQDSAPGDGADGQLLVAELHALRGMLLQSDMQALAVFERLRASQGPVPDKAWQDLAQAMEVLDFATAAQQCVTLLGSHANAVDAARP